jgi:ribonuclease P protein component
MSRARAYEELDKAMGNAPGQSHFGAMSVAECERAQAWAQARLGITFEQRPERGAAKRNRIECNRRIRRAQQQRRNRPRHRVG